MHLFITNVIPVVCVILICVMLYKKQNKKIIYANLILSGIWLIFQILFILNVPLQKPYQLSSFLTPDIYLILNKTLLIHISNSKARFMYIFTYPWLWISVVISVKKLRTKQKVYTTSVKRKDYISQLMG